MNSAAALLKTRRIWLAATYAAVGTGLVATHLLTDLDAAVIAGGAVVATAVAIKFIPQAARRMDEANLFKLAAIVPVIALLVATLADGLFIAQAGSAVTAVIAFAFASVLLAGNYRSAFARRIAPAAFTMRAASSSKASSLKAAAAVTTERSVTRISSKVRAA